MTNNLLFEQCAVGEKTNPTKSDMYHVVGDDMIDVLYFDVESNEWRRNVSVFSRKYDLTGWQWLSPTGKTEEEIQAAAWGHGYNSCYSAHVDGYENLDFSDYRASYLKQKGE